MMVDTSAIVAISRQEQDATELVAKIAFAKSPFTTTAALFEASMVLSSRTATSVSSALDDVTLLVSKLGIRVKDVDGDAIREAAKAADAFGKGRGHPARLNLCDCLSYGAARAAGVGLIYKGQDFAQTDLA